MFLWPSHPQLLVKKCLIALDIKFRYLEIQKGASVICTESVSYSLTTCTNSDDKMRLPQCGLLFIQAACPGELWIHEVKQPIYLSTAPRSIEWLYAFPHTHPTDKQGGTSSRCLVSVFNCGFFSSMLCTTSRWNCLFFK